MTVRARGIGRRAEALAVGRTATRPNDCRELASLKARRLATAEFANKLDSPLLCGSEITPNPKRDPEYMTFPYVVSL